MRKALVCGAGGFIGHHLVKRLKRESFWVRGVDLKYPEFCETAADDFIIGDLRGPDVCRAAVDDDFDEVYQLAADMGGAGFVFTGENDADLMHNSAVINLNMLDACHRRNIKRIFIRHRLVCIRVQPDGSDNPKCSEDSAYPAAPTANTAGKSSSVKVASRQRNHGWSQDCAIPQYFRSGRNMAGRKREGACSIM
jgi:nucleoside-diphosphate-sugar epimerase